MITKKKAAPIIRFGTASKDVQTWTIHQKRYVRSLILAAIYRPGTMASDEKREPIRRALSVHVASKMANAMPKLTNEDQLLYRKLCRLILNRFDSIIEAPNARQILDQFEFYPNKKKQQRFMKELYAAGAVVETMYRLHLSKCKGLKPSGRKARRIVGEWKRNSRWRHNNPDDGWKTFKPIAHLVAAWTITFPPNANGSLTRRSLTKLRDQLPQFISNAQQLREFLITPSPGKKAVHLSAQVCRPLESLNGLPPAKIPWGPFSPDDEIELLKLLSSPQRKAEKRQAAKPKNVGK